MQNRRIGVPPRWVRVFVLTPFVFVVALMISLLSPLVHLVLAAMDLVDPHDRDAEGRRRWRWTRVGGIALALCVTEVVGLLMVFVLWVAAGFGLLLGTRRFQHAHNTMFGWWLELVTRALRAFLGFRVERQATQLVDGPVLSFARHAGPGDAFLLARLVITDFRRQLRMIGANKLLWDPFLSYLLHRTPFQVCDPNPSDPAQALEAIAEASATMEDDSVLIIFPEGGNWTPARWQTAISRFRERGHEDLAERVQAMPHLLPPRPAGAAAALGARDDLTVVLIAHTGLEDLYSLKEIWRKVPVRRTFTVGSWAVPPEEVAVVAPEDLGGWLLDRWAEIEAWISERAAFAGDTAAAAARETTSAGAQSHDKTG